MSEQLSDVENNLALVFALEEMKIAVMRELAEQFQLLTTLNRDFGEAAQIFGITAESLQQIHDQSKASMFMFDTQGKVADFLERYKLNPIWMERSN